MERRVSAGGGPIVRARGLVKRFGPTRALDSLDLEVCAGEVHGFLGPNVAGKPTTIRALGKLKLDGGELSVFGLHPARHGSLTAGCSSSTAPCGSVIATS